MVYNFTTSLIYLAAVLGISFPGIPSAVITLILCFSAASLSTPPGFDATSTINASFLKAFNSFSVITVVGTVLITKSNLYPIFSIWSYSKGIHLFSRIQVKSAYFRATQYTFAPKS